MKEKEKPQTGKTTNGGMRLSGSREQAVKIKLAIIRKREGIRTIGRIR